MEKRLIYAVDDEMSIREIYEYALVNYGYEVKCFNDSIELFNELENKIPDLFILDIMLEGLNGYDILERLKNNNKTSEIPVIMVSAKGNEIDKVRGLNLGADDYLSKPFGILELSARINAKLRKNTKSDKKYIYKDIEIDDEQHILKINNEEINITLKLYSLLKLLIQNKEKVLERNYILDTIWGENYGETRTLDIHIAELRKLLKNSNVKINTIRGIGFILK